MLAPSPNAIEWRMHEREFVALMAALQALQALAIDVMLPALGIIAHDLGAAHANQRQLIVGVYIICAGLGSLLPGLLADRFGRRPVMFICLGSYVLFNGATVLVTDLTALLVLRGLAGFTASGLVVIGPTVIRDRFSGDRMARLQSVVAMVFMIVPILAPSLGQALLPFVGWRGIFGVVAALGAGVFLWAFLRLPETLHPEYRQRIDVPAIAANMRTVLTTRSTIGYVVGIALVQGAMFGYITSVQQLLGEHFGTGAAFPYFFALIAMTMAIGSLTNSRIVERFGTRRVSHTALLGYVVCGAVLVALTVSGEATLWRFVALLTASMCLMGLIGANFSAIALQPFARIAGSAASLVVFLRMILGSILGTLVGQAYDGTPRPLAVAMLLAGVGALAFVLFSERGRLFRRLHGQVPQV